LRHLDFGAGETQGVPGLSFLCLLFGLKRRNTLTMKERYRVRLSAGRGGDAHRTGAGTPYPSVRRAFTVADESICGGSLAVFLAGLEY